MKIKINGKELIDRIGDQQKHTHGLQIGFWGAFGLSIIGSITDSSYLYNPILFIGVNIFLFKFIYHLVKIIYVYVKALYQTVKGK